MNQTWISGSIAEFLGPAPGSVIAVVGAGGKTSLLENLACWARNTRTAMILSVTTKLAAGQEVIADRLILLEREQVPRVGRGEVILVAQRALVDEGKIDGVTVEQVDRIAGEHDDAVIVVEADGARRNWLKIPGSGEPQIPGSSCTVVAVTACAALNAPLSAGNVHRWDEAQSRFSISRNQVLTPKLMRKLLSDSHGCFKGAPAGSRRIWIVNQADSGPERERAREFCELTTDGLTGMAVIVGSVRNGSMYRMNQG